MKCQVFSFASPDQELVPNGLYMAAVVGDELSVGVVNFRLPVGADIPAKSHAHGEEFTLQLKGGCTVKLGVDESSQEGNLELEEGVFMMMPADQPHYGFNRFDSDGQCLRLNVVTPPRAEYGAKGRARAFYPTKEKA